MRYAIAEYTTFIYRNSKLNSFPLLCRVKESRMLSEGEENEKDIEDVVSSTS